jgi:two-component system sensor histidine kinase/response regulator
MKILIADDNAHVRRYMASVFEDKGHTVSEAANGQEALQAVGIQQFDAVLMDLAMPNMSGVEATRILRADPRHAALAIFAFTGMSDIEGFDRTLFTRTFLKPYPPLNLVEAIEKDIRNRPQSGSVG